MNRILRFSGIAVMSAAFVGGGTIVASAQDACADADGQGAIYGKFTELYPKTDQTSRRAAVEAGKQFLEKYGACEAVKEQNDYFKKAIPAIEDAIKKEDDRIWLAERFTRFDNGIKSNNPDEVYAAGQEIMGKQPENLNILIPMGLIGAYQSNAGNNFKYADNGVRFGRVALDKVNSASWTPKPNGKVGAFQFEFATKSEATNELKYAIAFLNYYGKKDKSTALPLYYELSQAPVYKEDPRIYGTIGDYYVEQRKPLAEQIRLKIEEQKKEGEAVEVKEAREEEIKKLVAVFNGYNERILDAYGRAYKVTKDTPTNKAYRDNLYKIMQDVYKQRFDKETGLDAYISTTVAKPFPNPTSEVTPVEASEPVKTSTSTTAAPATAQPAKAAAANGKTATTIKPNKK